MAQSDPTLKSCKLIPFSGGQFYVTAFDRDATGNFSRTFYAVRTTARAAGGEDVRVTISPAWRDDDPRELIEPPPGEYDEVGISKLRAYEAFVGRWMPVPMLRVLPGDTARRTNLDAGPTNWARVLVTPRDATVAVAEATAFDVVYLFDTELDRDRADGDLDTAPCERDAVQETVFRFGARAAEGSRFLQEVRVFPGQGQEGEIRHDVQRWASLWVERAYEKFVDAQRKGRAVEEEERRGWPIEARCRYLAFLQFLALAAPPPEVAFADSLSADPEFRKRHDDVPDKARRPVDATLVLDIGNSRTCGVIIETFPTALRRADLSDAMVLRLRDLSRPSRSYREPFESHVELAQPYFGDRDLSELSGRGQAFLWPSLVRVGPEAVRLRDQAEGIEALSGLSSPKRYLFDVAALNQHWRFQEADYVRFGGAPPLDDHVRAFVGPRGDVRRQISEEPELYRKLSSRHERVDINAYPQRLSFSRSSLFTFMLAEIFWQAFTMVNNPQVRATRAEADTPRRLSRIVLTIPTAMPISEQRILRSRANAAVKLLWDLLGWTERPPVGVALPVVEVSLDEASCVQVVYLYSELAQRFAGGANEYFDLVGRPRIRPEDEGQARPAGAPAPRPERSLRIASIDVGGGTTDLMITTYFLEDRKALVPYQKYREGFRVAGDDLLRDIVQRCILPALTQGLTEAGLRAPTVRAYLMDRFGVERADMREQDRHMRRQFVTRVLRPAAVALLHAAESADWGAEEVASTRVLRDLVAAGGGLVDDAAAARTARYIDDGARGHGAAGFSVLDITVPVQLGDVRVAVESTFGGIFGNIAEMVNHLDCDVVLFAGRPSKLPAMVELFTNRLAVSPDRVVALGRYETGPWYPFGSLDDFVIEDPKTATVTGAMLALFAQRDIENFTIFSQRLKHRSCARQIGELTANGQLLGENVIFTHDPNRPPGAEETGTLRFFTPVRLGYRQVPYDRWVATPLYLLRLVGGNAREIRRPVAVTLVRESPSELQAFESRDFSLDEARKEAIRIQEAVAADGSPTTQSFALELNTMQADAGYWLDTGILNLG